MLNYAINAIGTLIHKKSYQSNKYNFSLEKIGCFSISKTKKINFSTGNLYSCYENGTNIKNYACLLNQYDTTPKGRQIPDDAKFDFFKLHFNKSFKIHNNNNIEYDITYLNKITNPNDINNIDENSLNWRILSKSEWEYLLYSRENSDNLIIKNVIINNIKGVILLPDDFEFKLKSKYFSPYKTSQNLSTNEWNIIQSHGAIFMPEGKYMISTTYNNNTYDSLANKYKT